MNTTIDMFRGDSRTLEVRVTDDYNKPVDLTGASVRFTVRKKVDGAKLIAKSSSNPAEIEITDAANGIFKIYLKPADTKAMRPGGYLYDVEVTLSSGDVHTVVFGNFQLHGDIST